MIKTLLENIVRYEGNVLCPWKYLGCWKSTVVFTSISEEPDTWRGSVISCR